MKLNPNSLSQILARRILNYGAISLHEFMSEALNHPEYGYYTKSNPIGRSGDFITAPEISQMFGELIGVWCASTWIKIGKPNSFALMELGPGRGTLIVDALRALKALPECLKAMELHFVEINPQLKKSQEKLLSDYRVIWHKSLDDIPQKPTIFIANEFFDALPIEQLFFRNKKWYRRKVDLADKKYKSEPKFTFTEEVSSLSDLDRQFVVDSKCLNGSVFEFSPDSRDAITKISKHINYYNGAALIVDYGYHEPNTNSTLQAIQRHRYVDVLNEPGCSDLTAHVDFRALSSVAIINGVSCWGPISQGSFLRRLGIETRSEKLSVSASDATKESIKRAKQRLINEDQMGTLFKVMVLGQKSSYPFSGFLSNELSETA